MKTIFCIPQFLSIWKHSRQIKPPLENQDSLSSQGIFLLDRFGNKYFPGDFLDNDTIPLEVEPGPPYSCSSGYYSLYFKGSFSNDEKNTFCAVFDYLSSQIANTTSNLVNISIQKSSLDSGTIATGSVFYHDIECGLGDNRVLQRLYNSNFEPLMPFDGILHVADIEWNVNQNPCPFGMFDLYTVALHEALHILGFGSQVGIAGNPNDGFFSEWDTFLYSQSESDYFLSDSTTSYCGEQKIFNHGIFNSMPADIYSQCNPRNALITFDPTAISDISSNYSFTMNDRWMAQALSHLCDDILMEAQFTHCEMHSISGPEFEILCKLGYLTGECKENCLLDAVNDVYTIYTDDITINNTELLANDFAPLATVVALIPGCGDYGSLTITSILGGFYIDNLPVGITELCYQIVGCEGKIDQAKIFISVISSVADCNYPETCELVAFGTFEGLSAIEPYSDFILSSALPNGNSPELKVSCYSAAACGPATTICDMASPVSNHFVSFFSSFSKYEGICLPLCAALEVGQSYTFSFWAFAPCNFRLRPSLSVDKPCPKNTGVSVGGVLAPGLVLDPNPAPCSTMPPYSFTATAPWATLNLPATLDFIGLPTWQQFTYTFIAGQPYEFVSLVQFPSGTRSLDLDNISLVKTNTSEVTVSTEIIGCIDGQATIEYTLCSNELITLDLTASFPPSSGIVFSSSGDFIAGMATVTIPDDDCINIQLVFDVANSVADGNNFDVHLLGVVAGLCGNEINQIDNVAVSIPLPSHAADFLVLKDCPFVQFRHHGSSTGAQHSWDFGDGHTETSPDPLHLFVGLGPFTVTHIVSNHCNSVTFVQEVEGCEEFYCPIEEGTIGIDGRTTPVKLSDLITNNVLPSNFTQYQDFYLAGVLEIDISNYQFDHTNWFCDAGSEIVINGDNIHISNTTLKGCEKMWKGIRLSTGGGLRLSTCNIEDAHFGVMLEDLITHFICSGTKFDKDYIGIYSPISASNKNFVSLISGNTFDCTAPLLDAYPGQVDYPLGLGHTPFVPERTTYAGIYVNNVIYFRIAGFPNGNNIFQNVRNGVIGLTSGLNFTGNHMKNMLGTYGDYPTYTTTLISGFGIKLEGLIMADIFNNEIKNALIGIHAREIGMSTIHIEANDFSNFHSPGILYYPLHGAAIEMSSAKNLGIFVKNNFFSQSGPQVNLAFLKNLSLEIENNNSILDGMPDFPGVIGLTNVECVEVGGHIDNNTIDLQYFGSGIQVLNSSQLSINANKFMDNCELFKT